MAGRRARTGRGWDATPARPRRTSQQGKDTSTRADWGGAPWPDGAEPATSSRGAAARGDDGASVSVDPYEKAREICLRQLAVRPRTRAELGAALRKRGIDDEVAAGVLDRYDEVGLIDDAAFAKAWVTSRHAGRGLARRALANELRQRGVDSELVTAALEDLDGETEAATARALATRKIRTMSSAEPEAIFRRVVGMLARKGYPAGVAIGAVKDALAARADVTEFAEQIDVDALAVGGEVSDESDSEAHVSD